jgi:hypothetical protein
VDAKRIVLPVVSVEVDLLRELVQAELDRSCAVIDDIIVRAYDVVPAKHTDKAIAEIKTAILALVRSPLADLERKLACVEVKPEAEPEPEPEAETEAEAEAKVEAEVEKSKSKA